LKLSKINPDKVETFKEPFLSFDIDWAHDKIIEDTLNLVKSFQIDAIWFVTHKTDLIHEIEANKNNEVGIHPNFNRVMMGDFSNGKNAEEIIDRLLKLVPNCSSIRSHSVTQSSLLTALYLEKGITHETNDYIPFHTNLYIEPWISEEGMVKAPYFFSDQLYSLKKTDMSIFSLIQRTGLKIFNFHPIHIF
jgi:hypothetical protein